MAASALFFTTALVFSAPAAAQGNLLDKARDALGGTTTAPSNAPGSISPSESAMPDTTASDSAAAESSASPLSDGEVSSGLKEALKVGTDRVVGQVGATDGYNGDPAIRIPLPGSLQTVQSALETAGMSGMVDDLELRLNRAAEAAAPEAKEVFFDAITDMSLEDAQQIYSGPDDAATQYFKSKMTPALVERMSPIVNDSLSNVGAIRSYDAMMGQYKTMPFVPDAKADLTEYTVEKALDGLFHYVAQEEAAIRSNPAARSTELLQKVFGGS